MSDVLFLGGRGGVGIFIFYAFFMQFFHSFRVSYWQGDVSGEKLIDILDMHAKSQEVLISLIIRTFFFIVVVIWTSARKIFDSSLFSFFCFSVAFLVWNYPRLLSNVKNCGA